MHPLSKTKKFWPCKGSDQKSYSLSWLTPGDRKKVVLLEEQLFAKPFDAESLRAFLGRPQAIAMAVRGEKELVGYIIYHLFARHVEIVRVGIAPKHQRRGLGTRLVLSLMERCFDGIKNRVTVSKAAVTNVEEFFSKIGFKSVPADDPTLNSSMLQVHSDDYRGMPDFMASRQSTE